MVNIEKKDDRIKVAFAFDDGLLKIPVCVSDRMLEAHEVVADAIFDTGAQFSVMSRRMADLLRLELHQDCVMSGVGHSIQVHSALAVAFPGCADWYTFIKPKVIDNIALGVDFIIGMDIIRRGELSLRPANEGLLLEFVFDQRYFVNASKDSVNTAYDKYQAVFATFLAKGL